MITVDKSNRKSNAGRPSISEDVKDKAVTMYNKSAPVADICRECNVSMSSLYRILKERSPGDQTEVAYLDDISYAIDEKDVIIGRCESGNIGIYVNVKMHTDDKSVDKEISSIYLRTSFDDDVSFIDTGKDNLQDLNGLVISQKNAGTVYAVEFDSIKKSDLVIEDINADKISIRWNGLLNAFWDFETEVPFNMSLIAKYKMCEV